MSARFFAFDTETTGLDPKKDQIISIAILLLDARLNELHSKCIYAMPTVPVAPEAAAVNKYTPELWQNRGAITQDAMFQEVRSLLKLHEGLIPLGHNVKFDLDMLRGLFSSHKAFFDFKRGLSYHVYDTVTAAMFFDMVKFGKVSTYYRLTELDQRFGLGLADNAHDALSDVKACVELAKLLHKGLDGQELAPPPVVHSSLMRKNGSDNSWSMARGKHKGKSVAELYDEKPDYIVWMLEKVDDLSDEQRDYLKSFTC